MELSNTVEELIAGLGQSLRAIRLQKNLDQATLGVRAGVSTSAVRSLEAGRGSSLHTFVSILKALGREDWLRTVAPVATINPLTMPRDHTERQRARPPRPKGAI